MTAEEITALLHLPGCRDKYDLRFVGDSVQIWHEYIPGCFVEASTLEDAAVQMGAKIREAKRRRDAGYPPKDRS